MYKLNWDGHSSQKFSFWRYLGTSICSCLWEEIWELVSWIFDTICSCRFPRRMNRDLEWYCIFRIFCTHSVRRMAFFAEVLDIGDKYSYAHLYKYHLSNGMSGILNTRAVKWMTFFWEQELGGRRNHVLLSRSHPSLSVSTSFYRCVINVRFPHISYRIRSNHKRLS